jgi:hypothetical protein
VQNVLNSNQSKNKNMRRTSGCFHFFSSSRIAFFFITILLLSANNCLSQDWLYTVQPGDNLWDLSKKYLISIKYHKKLQKLNNILEPLHIPPGTIIRFPMVWLKAGSTMARISHIHGSVEIIERETGKVRTATLGMFLWGQDTIRTLEGSNATLEFADGAQLLLQSDSTLKIEKLKSYGSTGMADTKVRLQKGRLQNKAKLKSGPGSRFEISTPSAVTAVRGTEYRIGANEDYKKTWAEVVKGDVAVQGANTTQNVTAGFGTITFKGRPPLDPVALLPAPDTQQFESTYREIPFYPQFPLIQGAEMYRLQISNDDKFETLLSDKIFSTNSIWGPDLPDGNYVFRVHGIDKNGLEGLDAIHSFTLNARPTPPIRIQPVADVTIENPQPTFKWSEPQQVSGYVFQLADNQQLEKKIIDVQHHPDTELHIDFPLAPGQYYWRVASMDLAGEPGPFGDLQKFRIAPPAPDMSQAKLDTKETVFRWTKVNPEHQYRFQLATNSSFTDTLVDEHVTDSQYNLEELEGGSYYIRVGTIDADGFQGPFSPYQKVEISSTPQPWVMVVIPALIFLLAIL